MLNDQVIPNNFHFNGFFQSVACCFGAEILLACSSSACSITSVIFDSRKIYDSHFKTKKGGVAVRRTSCLGAYAQLNENYLQNCQWQQILPHS